MRPPLKIGICEDVDSDAQTIKRYIEQSGYAAETECFGRGEELLKGFEKGRYHVVFMDIYMDGMSGVETARALRKADPRVLIVFVTTSTDHALESYRLGALKYIEKPISPQSIKDALELAWTLREKRDVLIVYSGKDRVEIPLDDILYIEVVDHNCHIHTQNGTVTTYARFAEVLGSLPPRFLKCHRAYAVNMDHIYQIKQDFMMDNGDIVYISRKAATQVKKEYMKYLCNAAREME